MNSHSQIRFRILLSSTLLLIASAFTSSAQVRPERHRGDLSRQAGQMEHASRHFYELLGRSSTERGSLLWDARELAEESRHFYRSALRSRRSESLRDDFQQVRESYLRLRQSFHRRFQVNFIQGQDRWYADLMRAWADTAESYSALHDYFRDAYPSRSDPRHPIPGPPALSRQIRCTSEDYRPNSCFVGGRILSVELIDRKSRASCVEGSSFGSQGAYIWVKNGCDGEFWVEYVQDRR